MTERKVKVIDAAFLDKYVDIEIKYPFCYKTKNGKNFFRYLEDGRFEFICQEDNKKTMQFGCRANSLITLHSEDGFYLKVLANLYEQINEEDFEFQRELYYIEYKKYLNGSKYLSSEVEKIINKKLVEEGKIQNNDIIINNIEAPF